MSPACVIFSSFFFFNDTATTEIYTLSLHDALPIFRAELKYVTVRTRTAGHLLEESLTQLEQEFSGVFVRIHRNCLVARRWIRGVERGAESESEAGWSVVLEGLDERLPVSRRQWAQVKALVS